MRPRTVGDGPLRPPRRGEEGFVAAARAAARLDLPDGTRIQIGARAAWAACAGEALARRLPLISLQAETLVVEGGDPQDVALLRGMESALVERLRAWEATAAVRSIRLRAPAPDQASLR